MSKSAKTAVIIVTALVAAAVLVVLFLTRAPAPTPQTTSESVSKTAPQDRETAKKQALPTNQNSQTEKRIMRRPKRVANDPGVFPVDRRLVFPEPKGRRDFAAGKVRDKTERERRAHEAIRQSEEPAGPVPVDVTIEKVRRLRGQGKNDQAGKTIRNAILIERNPLERQRLVDELDSWGNPDGVKTSPTETGTLK